MSIPKIHTNLLWDLTVLFVLLTMAYFTIIFISRNILLLKSNNTQERKQYILGIINQLLFYEQDTAKIETIGFVNLKVELWKLLRVPGNKRITSNLLMELDKDLTADTQQKMYKLSEEFELHIDAFEERPNTTEYTDVGTKNVGIHANVILKEGFDVDFVPHLTGTDLEDDSMVELREESLTNYDFDFLMEFLDHEDYEVNPFEGVDQELDKERKRHPISKPEVEESIFLNLDFIPIGYEIEGIKEEIAMIDINEIEVDYEVVIDPFVKKQIKDMLKSHVQEQFREDIPFIDDGILDLGKMELPPAKYYTDREFKKVKLLHAIAELGDIREVPLLSEMMDEEDNESIGRLIKEIILKFLSDHPSNPDIKNPSVSGFGESYVYSHLFNSLDTESQLLLLDEIANIGEQNEIDFLETLHDHSVKGIRDKAKVLSTDLKSRVKDVENDKKTDFPDSSSSGDVYLDWGTGIQEADPDSEIDHMDLFQIDFDMAPPEKKDVDDRDRGESHPSMEDLKEILFMEQLKELTHKFFKK